MAHIVHKYPLSKAAFPLYPLTGTCNLLPTPNPLTTLKGGKSGLQCGHLLVRSLKYGAWYADGKHYMYINTYTVSI